MTEIHRAVARASRRLWINSFLRALVILLTAGVMVALIVRTTQQVFIFDVPWLRLAPALAGGAFAGALVWAFVAMPRRLDAARVLDVRADLRESLSTALALGAAEDPWAQLVRETGRQKAVSVDVKRAIPVAMPERWWWPLGAGLALMILWMSLPQAHPSTAKAKNKNEAEIQQVVQQIKEGDQKLQQLVSALAPDEKKLLEDIEAQKPDEAKPKDASELRAAELKRLESLADKLEELKKGEKAQAMDAAQKMMADLKYPGAGPLDDVFKQMARGDFGKASSALEALRDKIAKSELTPEQKKALAEQLERLAEQLAKQAEDSKDSAKALESAGMDAKTAKALADALAANPDSLDQVMDQIKGMNLEKMDAAKLAELANKLKGKSMSSKQLKKLAQSMKKMGQSCKNEGSDGEMLDAMEGMEADMDEMADMESQCEAAGKALAEARAQMAGLCEGGNSENDAPGTVGQWSAGDSSGSGNGTGDPGRGSGKRTDGTTPTTLAQTKDKARVENTGGPSTHTRLVQGDQVKGEARAALAETIESAKKSATEAINKMQIDPELHPAVKAYFTRMQAKTQDKEKKQ